MVTGPVLYRRLQFYVSPLFIGGNLVGAALVFVYLAWLSPVPAGHADHAARLIRLNGGVLLATLAVASLVGFLTNRRVAMRAASWLLEARRPTDEEKRHCLQLPWVLVVVPFAAWIASAVLFGLINYFAAEAGGAIAIRVVSAIVLGGLTTTGFIFLMTERLLRPMFALALADGPPDRPVGPGVLLRILLSWELGAAIPLLGVGLTQLNRTPAERAQLIRPVWFLVAMGLTVGAFVMIVAARSISDPIREIRGAMREVQDGNVDVAVAVDDGSEVGLLQTGFNAMAAGLRERRRVEDLFGRHVGTDVARLALARGAGLGGEEREVSALFVDVLRSTALAQRKTPTEVVSLLNDFFAVVVREVTAEGGWVNKFEGDGALCVFGAPGDMPDHAVHALRAARSLRQALRDVERRHRGFAAAIGVSAGRAVAGNVGAEARFEYTVIGDAVNEAARLCEAAKGRPELVLASEALVRAAGGDMAGWRADGELLLRGRRKPTRLYTLDGSTLRARNGQRPAAAARRRSKVAP